MGHRGIINWYKSTQLKHKPWKAALWTRAASWNSHQQLQEEFTPGLNHSTRVEVFAFYYRQLRLLIPSWRPSRELISLLLYTLRNIPGAHCMTSSPPETSFLPSHHTAHQQPSKPPHPALWCPKTFGCKSESSSGFRAAQLQTLLLK